MEMQTIEFNLKAIQEVNIPSYPYFILHVFCSLTGTNSVKSVILLSVYLVANDDSDYHLNAYDDLDQHMKASLNLTVWLDLHLNSSWCSDISVNAMRLTKMAGILQMTFSNLCSSDKIVEFWCKFEGNTFPGVQLTMMTNILMG